MAFSPNPRLEGMQTFLGVPLPVRKGQPWPHQTGWCFSVVNNGNHYYIRSVTYPSKEAAKEACRDWVDRANASMERNNER